LIYPDMPERLVRSLLEFMDDASAMAAGFGQERDRLMILTREIERELMRLEVRYNATPHYPHSPL
jgi:hypothetical protein